METYGDPIFLQSCQYGICPSAYSLLIRLYLARVVLFVLLVLHRAPTRGLFNIASIPVCVTY
jgi:hypothetical protein